MTLDRNVLSNCNSCIIWNHTRAPGRYVPAPGLALAAFPSPLVTEPIHVPVPLDDFVAQSKQWVKLMRELPTDLSEFLLFDLITNLITPEKYHPIFRPQGN